MRSRSIKTQNGQVMMIVVLVLSGIIIGATAVSGLLTARQTRQTVDAGNALKAVFAADAGLEWRMYKFIKDDYECMECPNGNSCGISPEMQKNDGVDSLITTACNEDPSKETADYKYFLITSTGKARSASYVINEEIRVIK